MCWECDCRHIQDIYQRLLETLRKEISKRVSLLSNVYALFSAITTCLTFPKGLAKPSSPSSSSSSLEEKNKLNLIYRENEIADVVIDCLIDIFKGDSQGSISYSIIQQIGVQVRNKKFAVPARSIELYDCMNNISLVDFYHFL